MQTRSICVACCMFCIFRFFVYIVRITSYILKIEIIMFGLFYQADNVFLRKIEERELRVVERR